MHTGSSGSFGQHPAPTPLVHWLHQAVEQGAASVLVTDRQGRIEYVNRRFTETTGYEPADILGRNPRILGAGGTPPEVYRNLWTTILAGREWRGELLNRKKNGELYWEAASIAPIRNDAGDITHFLAIQQDVTEHRRALEALSQAEQRLRNVLSATSTVIYALKLLPDGQPQPVWVSPNIERILGHSAQAALTRSWWLENLHPDDRDRVLAEELAGIGVGVHGTEYRLRDGQGVYHWILDQHRVVNDPAGGREIIGSWFVIDDRREAEEALRRSEARLREAQRVAHLGSWESEIPDPGGMSPTTPVWWSEEVFRIFGYAPEEIVPTFGTVIEATHPEDRPALLAAIERGLRDGRFTVEHRLVRRDRSERTVLVQAEMVRRPEDQSLLLSGTVMDVTDRKRLESQFRQAQKMEAVGRLAGGVAHDFNNVLTAITGFADLLKMNLDPRGPGQEELDEILRGAERAASMTRQLLAFSRQQVLKPRVLDLNRLIGNLEKMLRRLLGEDIDLATGLDPALGAVLADPGQLEQVLMNLAVNSRDAMPRGGRLTIETANVDLDDGYAAEHQSVRPGPYVRLSVSDTGAGMDEHVQAHLFDPFFTTKEAGKGTGLGLSTVYGIVKQSGGYIWVYSEPGKGSSFKIYLPLVSDRPESLQPKAVERPMRRGYGTILLAEDSPAVRRVTRIILSRQGYAVLEAESGAAALDLAGRHAGRIRLLITDVVMPGMSGPDLAAQLMQAIPGLKVLFTSGYADEAVLRHGLVRVGANYLSKPFTPDALIHKVQSILDEPAG